jgi:hypothetical protein
MRGSPVATPGFQSFAVASAVYGGEGCVALSCCGDDVVEGGLESGFGTEMLE